VCVCVQALFATTITSAVDTLQTALDGPHRALLSSASYQGGARHLLLQSTPSQQQETVVSKTSLEEALRMVFATVTWACLRNPALQKVCGSNVASSASVSLLHSDNSSTGGGVSSNRPPEAGRQSGSLLRRLCALTPKYYRENRLVLVVFTCCVNLCEELNRNGFAEVILICLNIAVRCCASLFAVSC
jgi:hypothetical protein